MTSIVARLGSERPAAHRTERNAGSRQRHDHDEGNCPPLLAAAGSTALLTLTGCASPDTFDFTQINGAPPAKELTVEIPDELLEMDSEYAESRVLESVTVKSVDLGDPKWCAVEADFDYADGDMIDANGSWIAK